MSISNNDIKLMARSTLIYKNDINTYILNMIVKQ